MDVKSQGKEEKAVSGKRNKLGPLDFTKIVRRGRPKKTKREGKGLIYIGRIPHGFYEDQMTGYFNQFGRVISAVVSRSKKTGRSKGYGFVEFEDEEVAKIAAETMNNYLMFNKVIKCRYIPPEERFKHKYRERRTLGPSPRAVNRIADARSKRKALTKLSPSAYENITQKKIAQFKKFFEERGINFNFKINSNGGKDLKASESEKDTKSSENVADVGIDDQFGVLEIDSSDAEIHFEIPPQVRKVIKKSSSTCTTSESNDSLTVKEPMQKRLKKSGSKEGQQIAKPKEQAKRVTRSLEEKNKMGEKISGKLSKGVTAEKNKSQAKKSETLLTQKKRKMKQAVEVAQQLKKEENRLKQKLQKKKTKKVSLGSSAGEKNQRN